MFLRTKLYPPQLNRRVLARPQLTAKLWEALDYRLVHVHAGTGYSKTTALASLAGTEVPLFWYTVGEADADPQRFLSYLIAAFRLKLPGLSDLPQAVLQEGSSAANDAAWLQSVDALLNALHESIEVPSLLVLDDYHLVSHSAQISKLAEYFVTYAPANLHVIIATRHALNWESMLVWRAKGDLLEINRHSLAFRQDEMAVLFRDVYGVTLSQNELDALADRTEGWPIALQLVWQGLRDAPERGAGDLLGAGSTSLGTLFDYLAHDVLGAQTPEISDFLRQTSVLRELTPGACEAVTGQADSRSLLERLLELDLFVVRVGESDYRYHHLFHDFLRQQLSADARDAQRLHLRAATFFEEKQEYEEAIYHWLQADEPARAAEAIEKAGEGALRSGWLETVAKWIDALPADVLQGHPLLQAYLADVYRMRSRFAEALAWYEQAERWWRAHDDLAGVSRTLRGQALIYLDTVRPAQAEIYLEEALRITEGMDDRESRARLLELLAENKLNMGKPSEAEKLRADARALRMEGPEEDALSVRVKLRTGRLDEARKTLESWDSAERKDAHRGQIHPPRSHRETLLLLSLIHAMQGHGEEAFRLAEEGIALGQRLESPFIEAVGHTRLGHAWQLRPVDGANSVTRQSLEEALQCYQAGIALGDKLAVRRMRAEAMWGLTRAYSFGGDLEAAQTAAAEGVETAQWAGDAWIGALIELSLGAGYVLAGERERAIEILLRVLSDFRGCGDSLGRAATRLWLALAYHEAGQSELSATSLEDSLALCEAHGYDFLFTTPSLLGPPDPRRVVPLLLVARAKRYRPAYVNRLLGELRIPGIQIHPGYTLRVVTLGAFRVFRGDVEMEARDWQRDRARQLFQLLLTQHDGWLQRDEIVDRLWPSLSPDVAVRDFKVALNALNKALEPSRASDAPFAFIVREGSAYRIRPEADLWLDARYFEKQCLAALKQSESEDADKAMASLQAALQIYSGDFLPDTVYDDWASAERERLLSIYLRTADKYAGLLVEQGQFDDGIAACARILDRDPCWERAYRTMMLAYAKRGDRPLALRAYQRCVETMLHELSAEPSAATNALYWRILHTEDLSVTGL